MRRTFLVVALAALLAIVLPTAAFAERGGNGGGKRTPTITVGEADGLFATSATADGMGVLMVNGADHARDVPVFVAITGENSVLLRTDRSGSFAFGWSPQAGGSHTLTTYQYRNGKGWEKAATVTVEVSFAG